MKIGIDARTILNPEKGEDIGIGHYTYQLIRNILDIDQENKYVLFFDWRARKKDIDKFSRPNVKIKFYPFSDYKKYIPGAYNEILGSATLVREELDVLHSTSPQSRIPITYRGKAIVTFHDLSPYLIPECCSRTSRAREKALSSLMARKADKVIAVSESIKKDLKKIFKMEEDKIEVIYSGLDKRFFENPLVSKDRVLEKFGISKKYILFLGTLEPAKNLTRLFQAFAKFKEERIKKGRASLEKFDYQLVVAGKSGWLSKQYPQIAKDLGIGKDVVFTGYLVGDDLVPLFRNCQFFVMPSLYEGFGMTLLEAFATGAPAIVSDVCSMPELAKDAARQINPVDVDGLVNSMLEFSSNEQLRESYRQKGLERAKDFSWEDTARKTIELYRSFEK